MELTQNPGRQGEQRRAGKAAAFPPMRRTQPLWARQGGVADDDPIQPIRLGRGADVVDLWLGEVGGDLEEQRPVAGFQGKLPPGQGQPPQKLVQGVARLKGSEARRVGRGDVGGEVVGERPEPAQARHIVRRPIGRLLVGPDVGPDDPGDAAAAEVGGEGLQAHAVEAVAVDHGAVLGQAEHARAGVAGLGQGRDRAALHEAEPGGQHGVRDLGVLVEARGQAKAVGQAQTGELHRQNRIVGAVLARPEACPDRPDPERVGRLGVQMLQRREPERVYQAHASSPAGESGTGSIEAAAATGMGP